MASVVLALTLPGQSMRVDFILASLVDPALIALFAYGTYRRSRVSAVLLLLVFLVNKLMMLNNGVNAISLAIAVAVPWAFALGVIGTFQYQAIRKRALEAGGTLAGLGSPD